ncbi:MAG: helix-turn-helix domain-containing protein [Alphaproteobacteria bacterium]|nr:helix-turn-helix domain-containing protein [Alphaproteobacteria bacterium]
MTPFGQKLRDLRALKGVTQKDMARALGVSAAYLSALEHGNRGRPGPGLIRQICDYFGLIWDDAEDLKRIARVSAPRVVLDTAGLSPLATELAAELVESIHRLDDQTLQWILDEIRATK